MIKADSRDNNQISPANKDSINIIALNSRLFWLDKKICF